MKTYLAIGLLLYALQGDSGGAAVSQPVAQLTAPMLALVSACFAGPKLPKRPGFTASASAIHREPDYTGRQAMMVDGKQVGKLERQPGGTYLLRYPDGSADKCSINEVILMPESK